MTHYEVFLDALIWIVLCPLMAVYYQHHCHQELRLGLMKYNHHNFHFANCMNHTMPGMVLSKLGIHRSPVGSPKKAQ